jgi:hypothetical protein
MALQIRRGTTQERLGITFLQGEIVFDTTENQVFIGDGETPGGIPVTTYADSDAVNAVAEALTAGTGNVTFTYDEENNRLNASVTLDGGLLNIVEDLTPQLGGDLDLNSRSIAGTGNINITGSVTASLGVSGNLTGNVTGNVSGNVTGNVSGNVTGNVIAQDATVLINSSDKQIGNVGASLVGSLIGSVSGDVTTTSIVSPTAGDISVTSGLDLTSTLNVDGSTTLDDVTITGTTLFDLANDSVVIKLQDLSGGIEGTVSEVLKLTLLPQSNLGSGPAISFTVGPSDVTGGNEPEENIGQIVAKKDTSTGIIEISAWDPIEESFSLGVGIAPDFVFFNNEKLTLNNTAFFTHSEDFPVITTTTTDITFYPESEKLIVYANVTPGIEDGVASGSFNLGSSTEQFNNAFLAGGVVTTAPSTSAGKEGDVAGAVAFDGSYVYRCTADYTDGLTAIWTRAPLTFSSF